jgi:hypothetical protein
LLGFAGLVQLQPSIERLALPQLNPVTLFAAESAYNQALFDYRVRADRIMVGMNLFLTLVCLVIAPYRGTWVEAVLIGLPTLGLSYGLQKSKLAN